MKLKSTLLLSAAVLIAANSFGQFVYKVTTNGKKYVLVEESTGPGCGYCPDGAQDIEQSIEPDTTLRAVIASWHDATYDATSMVLPGNPFSSHHEYIGGDPEATIDRYPFGGPEIGQSRPWESYVSTRKATPAKFDVTMKSLYKFAKGGAIDSAKNDSGTLTITIIGKSLSAQTGTWNVNVFITEDSISSAPGGYQQHSYLTSNATACNGQPNWFQGLGSVLPDTSYSHMNVVRAVLASGGSIFGDLMFTNPAANATVTKTYTYKFDTTQFKPKYMKVLAMIQTPGPVSATTGNPIENVISNRVRLMPHTLQQTAVEETAQPMADVTVYPNPANNTVTVRGIVENPGDTKIDIYNAMGQVVLSREYKGGGSLFGQRINVSDLSNGNYFMTITNDGAAVTKEFTIQR